MNKPITFRIAHFIDTHNKGGAEVTLMDLCTFQKQAGHEVIVFHHHNAYISEECDRNQIKQVDIPAYYLYKSTYTLPFYALFLALKLKQLNVDVLHSHLFGPITGNALATRLAGCKHIGTLHDIYMIEEKPARARLLQLASLLHTRLVCVSHNMAAFYAKYLNSDALKIHTIYNAAQIPDTPSPETKSDLKARFQLFDTDTIITAVGRLVPLKRIDRIINSLHTINRPEVKLVIIGDGPELASLQTLTSSLKLDSQVVFTGEITNVSDILYLSDIFIQFSSTEGLSKSIIEAMSCGLPCVVSDVGGNSELVVTDQTGFVIPKDRDDLLVDCLCKLLDNTELRSQFGKRALLRFNEYLTFDRFQNSYLELYAAGSLK